MSLTDDTWRIAEELRRLIGRSINNEQRALVAGWARAWDTVADQWADAVDDIARITAAGGTPTQTQILNLGRARNAIAATIEAIDELAADMGVRLGPVADQVVTSTARTEARLIASQWPVTVDAGRFDRVNPQALDAIVRRTTTRITAAGYDLSPHAYQRMLTELTRAVPAGLSPREAAARMLTRLEGGFNGGLPRALTIARTEILDAYRNAAFAQHQANADVLAGWIWSARLDLDTCPACIAMHGSMHRITTPGPLGHPNCRCARVPVTRSWADLGFDIPEPEPTITTGEEWFAGLDRDQQTRIMGPARLAALDAGTPFADLATVRHSRGWRDSIVPTPVGALSR